jgi:hypothetical protein
MLNLDNYSLPPQYNLLEDAVNSGLTQYFYVDGVDDRNSIEYS